MHITNKNTNSSENNQNQYSTGGKTGKFKKVQKKIIRPWTCQRHVITTWSIWWKLTFGGKGFTVKCLE